MSSPSSHFSSEMESDRNEAELLSFEQLVELKETYRFFSDSSTKKISPQSLKASLAMIGSLFSLLL